MPDNTQRRKVLGEESQVAIDDFAPPLCQYLVTIAHAWIGGWDDDAKFSDPVAIQHIRRLRAAMVSSQMVAENRGESLQPGDS